jgi:hypothetical protein
MDRKSPIFLALLLSFFAGIPAFAQSDSSAASPASQSGQTAESPLQTAPIAPAQPVAKKVWTNDDMPDMRAGAAVSKNALPVAKSSTTTVKQSTVPKPKDAKWYHDQITKLQAQLPPLESQITELQAALSGQIVDSTRKYAGVKPDDWSVQLTQLQQKRDDILSKIIALQDQARHDGVPANTLP